MCIFFRNFSVYCLVTLCFRPHPSNYDSTPFLPLFFCIMAQLTLNINKQSYKVDVDPETPLLWVIRDEANLTGTKFGCGIAQCGACTVHLNGAPVRSCSLPVSAAAGQKITTIEGLSPDRSHVLQQAWIAEQVPQCGYCQSGQLMSASALLASNPSPTDEEIDAAMQGNICRCGTYPRIRKAIHRAAAMKPSGSR